MSQDRADAATGLITREAVAAMSGLERLLAVRDGTLPTPPFAETTAMRLAEAERGRVLFRKMPSSRFYNPQGTVHGGWIATLLDSAMACAVQSLLGAGQGFTTTAMTVNYVRPVLETGGEITCVGEAVHVGGRLATAEGRVLDANGRVLAHGSESCMVFAVTP